MVKGSYSTAAAVENNQENCEYLYSEVCGRPKPPCYSVLCQYLRKMLQKIVYIHGLQHFFCGRCKLESCAYVACLKHNQENNILFKMQRIIQKVSEPSSSTYTASV